MTTTKNTQTLDKSIFKEKKSIKGELLKALEEKTPLNYSSLAKKVGISVHRVRKYCKTHNIDLNDYNLNSINQPVIKDKTAEEKPKRKKKIIMQSKTVKIAITNENKKFKID